MEKRKILYVITKSNWGGAQRYVYDLATNAPKNYEVIVALGGNGELATRLTKKGVRVVRVLSFQRDISITKEFHSFKELYRLYKNERPDVVHLNSSKAGGSGALMARVAGVPRIIFTAHGWAFNEQRPFYARIIIKFLAWITILLSHTTITVSKKMIHDMASFPFTRKKIVTIYNALHPFETIRRSDARNTLLGTTARNTLWIGTIAELHTNKGIDIAFRAMQQLRKQGVAFTYVVMGEGTERDALEMYVRKHDLTEHVHLVGHTQDAAHYLQAFDIFLLPSRTEALGYVLLEAGYAARPVVASRVGGIPEIIEHGKNGLLIDPNDHSTIATALKELVSDEEKRVQFGEKLKQKVEQEFSFENMLEKTYTLY